jgi:hypothetical protein
MLQPLITYPDTWTLRRSISRGAGFATPFYYGVCRVRIARL